MSAYHSNALTGAELRRPIEAATRSASAVDAITTGFPRLASWCTPGSTDRAKTLEPSTETSWSCRAPWPRRSRPVGRATARASCLASAASGSASRPASTGRISASARPSSSRLVGPDWSSRSRKVRHSGPASSRLMSSAPSSSIRPACSRAQLHSSATLSTWSSPGFGPAAVSSATIGGGRPVRRGQGAIQVQVELRRRSGRTVAPPRRRPARTPPGRWQRWTGPARGPARPAAPRPSAGPAEAARSWSPLRMIIVRRSARQRSSIASAACSVRSRPVSAPGGCRGTSTAGQFGVSLPGGLLGQQQPALRAAEQVAGPERTGGVQQGVHHVLPRPGGARRVRLADQQRARLGGLVGQAAGRRGAVADHRSPSPGPGSGPAVPGPRPGPRAAAASPRTRRPDRNHPRRAGCWRTSRARPARSGRTQTWVSGRPILRSPCSTASSGSATFSGR